MFPTSRTARSRILALAGALALSVPAIAAGPRVPLLPEAAPRTAPPVATLSGRGFRQIFDCYECIAAVAANGLVSDPTPYASVAGTTGFLACEKVCMGITL